MNRQRAILFGVALGLMAATTGLLAHVHSRQRLEAPGVKTHPLADPIRVSVDLPERVLDYSSQESDIGEVTRATLPPDTSYGSRRYQAPDGFALDLRVVLMGTDRTSLHKPQFCLTGAGWEIDETTETRVPITKPFAYDLPIVRLTTTVTQNGHRTAQRGLYLYWYVAADRLSASASGFQRMWWMAEKLIRTGILQRWAYVSCYATCAPGQEEATFKRLKAFLAESVPQFQLVPSAPTPDLRAQR